MTALADAAKAYACAHQLAVFPLMVRDKKPLPFSTGFEAASTSAFDAELRWAGKLALPVRKPRDGEDPAKLPARILGRPACNIGCATGPISGVWVLDLDGALAEQGLADLVAVHGPLPETPEQATGGGRQIFFAWDPAFAIRNSASKIGKDIDVRGDGGYVVLPPSVHPGNPKKATPPGRIYTWAEGKSPADLPFARAPEWLMVMAMPAEAPSSIVIVDTPKPRLGQDGQASRYGEAVLATACKTILNAGQGQRQATIWGYSCQIGGFVAGGEIREAYALEQLTAAALNMGSGLCDSPDAIRRHVARGVAAGMRHPRVAPEARSFMPAGGRRQAAPAKPAAAAAHEIRDVRGLWAAARDADCGLVRSWLKRRGLDPYALPGALQRLRAYDRAPLGDHQHGAAMLVPLFAGADFNAPIDAVIVVPLVAEMRLLIRLGPQDGRVAILAAPTDDPDWLVATSFNDAWALGAASHESGHELGVVFAPTLQAFAGGALGDKWGRVDTRTPHADPEQPPWTAPGAGGVFLAVRGDLKSPELRERQTFGGSRSVVLEGDAAARFYGGLA
ncbi:MAG: bifunctional DNA primase/polymerase, partial [Proteobacteria bacterium]|nr:bifunctional DNA primase/polymerase [Pseudomonadota bacterium]